MAELGQASAVRSGRTLQRATSDISALPGRGLKRPRSEDDEATPPRRIELSANNRDEQLAQAEQAAPIDHIAPGEQIAPGEHIAPGEQVATADQLAPTEQAAAGLSTVQLRRSLQTAVQALTGLRDDSPAELTKSLQSAAHFAARDYGTKPTAVLDRGIPFLQATSSVGVGALVGFGIPGRAVGVALADAGIRGATGNPEWDVFRPAMTPTGAAVGIQVGSIGAGYVAGSIFGGAGNFAAQKLLVPVVNNILRRTLKPVPVEAVVPDEMVQLLNARPDADGRLAQGTRLRQAAADMSKSAAALDNLVNVRFGQLSFGITAALAAGVPKPLSGFAGAVAIGGAVSFVGGAGLGGLMANNQMRSKIKVPDLALLRMESANPTAEHNTAINPQTWHSVPLFYSHHKPSSLAADVSAGFGFASYADMGKVVSYRMAGMARASFSMSAALLVPKLTSLATNSAPVLYTVAAVSAGVGTYIAIAPWFNSLVHQFPANDQAHRPPPANTATNLQLPNPADNPQTASSFAPVTNAEPAIDIEAQQGTLFGAGDNVRSI